MKAKDMVQVKQQDGGAHWVYAQVIDAKTLQVQIQHPGNAEHGLVKMVAAEDIRTKADVLSIADVVRAAISGKPFNDGQLRALASIDPWFEHFMKHEQSASRTRLHHTIVQHYQEQAKQLS